MIHRWERKGKMEKDTEKDDLKKEEQVSDECLETVEEETPEEIEAEKEQKEADEACEKKIAELEEKFRDSLDKHQRTLAEFDNFRKRTMKEKAGMYNDGVGDTVEKILPVLDNLDRAIKTQEGKSAEEDSLLTGIKMVHKQLKEILTSLGVEEIPALGEKFNPNLHAAVAHEDNEEFGENEIMFEMLKGYKFKDKVLRPSMVKVAN